MGSRAVKLRLGYPNLTEDRAALAAVRRRLPATTAIMVDYNQALTVAEALHRGAAVDAEGIYLAGVAGPPRRKAGAARLARELKTPVQIGGKFSFPASMATAIATGACDYVMPDLQLIGGVTGWLRAAALLKAYRIEMSSPPVSGGQCPSAGGDSDRPLARMGRLGRADRRGAAADRRRMRGSAYRPGNGLAWNAKAVERFDITPWGVCEEHHALLRKVDGRTNGTSSTFPFHHLPWRPSARAPLFGDLTSRTRPSRGCHDRGPSFPPWRRARPPPPAP